MSAIREALIYLGLAKDYEEWSVVAEKMSLLRVLPDRQTTLTKGGRLARIIEVRGKDYSGTDSKTLLALFEGRKRFFETMPNNMMVFAQSHRVKTTRDMGDEYYSIPLSKEIAQKWAGNFTESFRTRHFIVICTAVDSLFDKVEVASAGGNRDEELYRMLNEYTTDVLGKLSQYAPRVLSDDEVASYWAWLINGRHSSRKLPSDGFLDDILATTRLEFPRGRQRFGMYDESRYSAMLQVAKPGTFTDPRFLDGLYRLNREFSIWQIFRGIPKEKAIASVDDRIRNNVAFTSAGDILQLQFAELKRRLQGDDITLQEHRFVIEAYGMDALELEQAAQEIKQIIENKEFGVKRESKAQELHFWSRFPEFDQKTPQGPPNPRYRDITSENAAHFCTFASAGEGLDSCSWGDAPVSHFKTANGGDYAFTFHGSPAKKWPGHTLIVGGNNSGKTTFAAFLLSQCYKYPDFRALCFDRLHGLEVFTRCMGGEYLDIVDGLEFNPLTLPDNKESRAFLANWFELLTGRNNAKDAIEAAIRQNFEVLNRNERTLAAIAPAFGLPEAGSIRSEIDRWVSGQFSGFFNAPRDAMDFTRQLVSIDMTTLLDLPQILAPLTYYLFHKLLVQAKDKGGYAVFVDELPRYLANEVFASKIEMMLQELRKTDGVFIGALQSIDTIIESSSAAKFLTNIETYALFPEPLAKRQHFTSEGLRLNDQEWLWLTQTHRPREVLIKRKSGESTILNVDLSSLGKYLRAFDSSADSVVELNALRRNRHDWQAAYLNG